MSDQLNKPAHTVSAPVAQASRTSVEIANKITDLCDFSFKRQPSVPTIKAILEKPALSDSAMYQHLWHHCNNGFALIPNLIEIKGFEQNALAICAIPDHRFIANATTEQLLHSVTHDSNLPVRTGIAYMRRILEIFRDEGKITDAELSTVTALTDEVDGRLEKVRGLLEEYQVAKASQQGAAQSSPLGSRQQTNVRN
jgi:hypothetical protein